MIPTPDIQITHKPSCNDYGKDNYNAGVKDAISIIQQYLNSYPESIFQQPPIGQHGNTVDSCSAAALRAVLPHIIEDIRKLIE